MSKPTLARRPTKYTKRMAVKLCKSVAEGISVAEICRNTKMPSRFTFYNWLKDYPEFTNNYVRAREEQADYFADQIIEIADKLAVPREIKVDGKKVKVPKSNEEINAAKVAIDARKWKAGRMAPKKYGDKVQQEVSGPDGAPVEYDHTWTIKVAK